MTISLKGSWKYSPFELEFSLQELNRRGAKAGKPVIVDIPKPRFGLDYDPEKHYVRLSIDISNLLLIPGENMNTEGSSSGGRGIFVSNASTLGLYDQSYGSMEFEQILELFKIDPDSGAVKRMAESTFHKQNIYMEPKALELLDGRITVINEFSKYLPKGTYKYTNYISKFDP